MELSGEVEVALWRVELRFGERSVEDVVFRPDCCCWSCGMGICGNNGVGENEVDKSVKTSSLSGLVEDGG